MVELCLKLGPVYSKLADETDFAALRQAGLEPQLARVLKAGDGYKLRHHQAETWLAFNDPEVDVIFDTALTGDGKSLAGQLPMLTQGKRALLMYPTNELIKDQEKGVKKYIDDFGLATDYKVMYGERITELMEEQQLEYRRQVVIRLFNENDCILSNPDLFHLMSSRNYGTYADQREYPYIIPNTFDYFLFDEFHVFGAPQIISVLNILNYHKINKPKNTLKYIFLSATPTVLFKQLLNNSGFRHKTIEGEYSPVPAEHFTTEPIIQPVTLKLHPLSEKGALAWAKEHLAEIVEFYQAEPDTKGVFIVNSVATAKLLVNYYKEELEARHGIIVGENTGLTNRGEANRAMQPDSKVQFIIATSTIDVGVDFRINLLIFEAVGAGTFIQRLGRLGRHQGWSEYRAYALLPDWIVDKFAARFKDSGPEIERLEFIRAVRGSDTLTVGQDDTAEAGAIFQPDQQYKNYAMRWGRLQSAALLVKTKEIGHYHKDDQFIQELQAQYNQLYCGPGQKDKFSQWVARYYAMSKGEDKEQQRPILDELNSFRGRSPLTCGIIDETDGGHLKTYDLFFLLANTEFQLISEAEFRREVERRKEKFEKYQSRDLKIYLRLKSFREERDSFLLNSGRPLKGKLNQVRVFTNLTIRDSQTLAALEDNSVNERLAELSLVGLVGEGKPKEFKRLKRLELILPAYAIQARGEEKLSRSIVFGHNALLAHSQIPWKALSNNGDDDECFIY